MIYPSYRIVTLVLTGRFPGVIVRRSFEEHTRLLDSLAWAEACSEAPASLRTRNHKNRKSSLHQERREKWQRINS